MGGELIETSKIDEGRLREILSEPITLFIDPIGKVTIDLTESLVNNKDKDPEVVIWQLLSTFEWVFKVNWSNQKAGPFWQHLGIAEEEDTIIDDESLKNQKS